MKGRAETQQPGLRAGIDLKEASCFGGGFGHREDSVSRLQIPREGGEQTNRKRSCRTIRNMSPPTPSPRASGAGPGWVWRDERGPARARAQVTPRANSTQKWRHVTRGRDLRAGGFLLVSGGGAQGQGVGPGQPCRAPHQRGLCSVSAVTALNPLYCCKQAAPQFRFGLGPGHSVAGPARAAGASPPAEADADCVFRRLGAGHLLGALLAQLRAAGPRQLCVTPRRCRTCSQSGAAHLPRLSTPT